MKMTDWTKPQLCQECGKRVKPNENHTYQDCLDWRKKIIESHMEKINLREHLKRLMRKCSCMGWTVGKYEKELNKVLDKHKGEIVK